MSSSLERSILIEFIFFFYFIIYKKVRAASVKTPPFVNQFLEFRSTERICHII
nr:MAG TPA: hypothetical protein [Caudoviricetes sp.]